MQTYFVYVISSQFRKYIYVGLTADLERRLAEHFDGKERTTKPYRPYKILFTETFGTRVEARMREKYLKSGKGKEWIKANFEVQ